MDETWNDRWNCWTKSCHLRLGFSLISSQLANLLIDVSNERGPHSSCRAIAQPEDTGEIVPFVSRQHRRSAASCKRPSAAHVPFHHSQPFTPDLFLQWCYFKPHVERCQRVPVSVPSSLCVPMRQMLISRPGRAVVVSADLCCWLKPCVFLWPCACLLAFLCAGIALPLYSYIDAAVCSSLVLSVPLSFRLFGLFFSCLLLQFAFVCCRGTELTEELRGN